MRNIIKLGIVISASTCSLLSSAHLVINELMQSNIDFIKDDLNDYPDSWVELYNPGPDTEDLSEYALGSKEKVSKAYKLPTALVKAGEHLVIYCDKASQGLHTDFRLESGKDGAVYLFKGNETVDYLEGLKKQPAPNIAYGRETDNSEKWGYQLMPTPGKSNSGKICKEILSEPLFNTSGKVFSDSFDLSLNLPEDAPEGTIIRYTLDGKEPTDNSTVYTAPIKISNTTVVRAKLFCNDYLSPRSTTHSYIQHPRNLTLPLVSIVSDDKYFYDEKEGILVEGSYSPGTPNYEYDWRRPVNYEYFEGIESSSSINQLCEIRVKGGSTRKRPLKSMAVYANKRFGTKRFNYEFFPDQTPGIDEFKSFEMRNSGDDYYFIYMRDAIIQQSMGMNCDLDWQPSRPVILYINGEYKGILNIRPRSNEDYVYSYYDGLEDIDMLENWVELKEGSMDSFYAFKEFYTGTDHNFNEFEEWMDTGEFCNLMIMNIFFDNKDFPGNNIVMWRPQEEKGRWRWICKDTDFGMGLYNEKFDYPTLNWITTPGFDNNHNEWANREGYSRLFRRLLDTPEFKDMFIDRCAVYLGDFLRSEEIIARIDARKEAIEFEHQYHRELLEYDRDYNDEIEKVKDWTNNRCQFFYDHMAAYFNLEQPIPLVINNDEGQNSQFTVNGIKVQGDSFNGKYFPRRNLKVECLPDVDNMYVNGWKVKVTDRANTSVTTYNDATLDIEMPAGENVVITPLLSNEPLGIDTVTSWDSSQTYEIFDITGRFIGNSNDAIIGQSGCYIIRQGSLTKKIFVK